jgi:hypothetical protein
MLITLSRALEHSERGGGQDRAAEVEELAVTGLPTHELEDVVADREVPGLVVVDPIEHDTADRIGDLVDKELEERAVECDLEHRDRRGEHGEREAVGVPVEPAHGEPDARVGRGHLAVGHHPPAAHQRELGVGVALLLGLEVAVDLGQHRIVGAASQRREGARADLLDPGDIGHERAEPRPLLLGDQVGPGGVPVDVAQRPLALLDASEHPVEVVGHASPRLRRETEQP